MNSRFIPLRVTPSDKNYRQIRTDYKVRGTPTALFLNSRGEEIDRKIGFNGKKDEYFQIIKDFSAGKGTLLSLMTELKGNPDDVETNFNIGKRYIDRYEWKNVYPYMLKVLEMDPENEHGFKSEATYDLAIYELRINGKIESLENFIATCTDRERLYQAYANLASHYIRTEKYDEASDLYEEALEKMPENAALMTDYAMFVFTNKIEDKYEKGYERAKIGMSLNPDDEDILFSSYYGILSYYKNTNKQEKYFDTFEEVLQKLPKNTFFKYSYAEAILTFNNKEKIDSGIDVVLDALEREPKAAHLWHSLSNLYFERGDLDKAIESALKALEIVPDSKQYKETFDKFKKAKKEND